MIADVSNYHKVNDWAKVKSNCSFLIGRATQGDGTKTTANLLKSVDRYCYEFIAGCEEHGIPYWLYVYLDKGNEKKQAEYMVKVCKDKVGAYFRGYVLDVEASNTAAGVQEALDYIKTQSAKTMIYVGYNNYTQYKSVVDNRGENCAWWQARYGVNDGYWDKTKAIRDGVDLHQYTSNGTCAGISGKCDLNRLTGTKPESWFTKKEVPKENKAVTAKAIIDTMASWIGKDRAKGTHKDIIDLYNSYKPLARGYKVKYTDEYCAVTVSAAFIKNKAVDLIGGTECSVQRLIEDCFIPKGIWNEDGRITPKAGYIICYNWDDTTQPNDGWADHVGVVEKVASGKITVIEGNISGKVGRRTIAVGAGTIRGYACPKYGKEEQKEEPKEETTLELVYKTMKGDFGTGLARRAKLGGRYKEVQDVINHIASASTATLAKETVAGKYGNGEVRKVVLGSRYKAVQAEVNKKYGK